MPPSASTEITLSLQRAAALISAGEFSEAEDLCRRILSDSPGNLHARRLIGVIAFRTGRQDQAITELREVIEVDGGSLEQHLELGNMLQTLSRHEEAVQCYERALELAPDATQALHGLGVVLNDLGKTTEAIAAHKRCLAIDSKAANVHYDLAMAYQGAGRLSEAVASFRQAAALAPWIAAIPCMLAEALLMQGDAEGAMAACEEGLRLDPGNRRAFANKAVALNEVGEPGAAKRLMDLDRFLWTTQFEVPEGFTSLTEFNAALAQHVREHQTLGSSKAAMPMRFGRKTGNLQSDQYPAIAGLERNIRRAIDGYIEHVGLDPAHPFLAIRPRRWRLSIWANVLKDNGEIGTHIHPAAWLSGAYYASFPEAEAGGDPQSGWIEFGRPKAEYRLSETSEVRTIRPEEGKLVLFPSYFFHRTLPFQSSGERISFGVDVLPEERPWRGYLIRRRWRIRPWRPANAAKPRSSPGDRARGRRFGGGPFETLRPRPSSASVR